MSHDLAVKALADIRLHPGIASALAKAGHQAARDFLTKLKPAILSVFHPDLQRDKFGVDPALASSGFQILLQEIDEESLLGALHDYGATFVDASQTILALRKQITEVVPELQQRNTELAKQLGKYQQDEGWLIEQARLDNEAFLVRFIDEIVRIGFRRLKPFDSLPEEKVTREMTLAECRDLRLISEIVPMKEILLADRTLGTDETIGQERAHGLEALMLQIDKDGRARCHQLTPQMQVALEERATKPALGWFELNEMLEQYLETERYEAELQLAPKYAGLLLGFLNPVELGDRHSLHHYVDDLWKQMATTMVMTLPEVREDVLPLLAANGFIRRQQDQFSNRELHYRVRLREGSETTDWSSYAVILGSEPTEDNRWSVTFVPIGGIWEKKK